LALGEPIGPYGLVTGAQLAPVLSQAWVIAWPKLLLAGLLAMSAGELVWRLWFQDAAACAVSPLVTRAESEVSIPLIRKFCPLVL